MSDHIPEEVKRFLINHIDSVAELEILVFLRERRDRSWSCRPVADYIFTSEEITADLLVKLTDKGLLTADGMSPASFRYGPQNQNLARLLDQLAEAYTKYLVPITNLVHKKSRRNIESVAEAFKLKKEE